MGFGRRNDEQNPPLPLQDHGQGVSQIREGGAGGQVSPAAPNGSTAHFMPSPNAWPAISSYQNRHGMNQSYPYDPRIHNNSMIGVTRPNYLPSPQVDPNFVDFRGGLGKIDVCSSGLQSSQVNANVVPSQGSSAGVYHKNGLKGETEAEASTTNLSLQVTASSLNLGYGATMLNQNADAVPVGLKNETNASVLDAGKVDGSFLTLGRGSNAKGPQGRFHPREVGSNLGVAVGPRSSNSNIRPVTSLYHNFTNDLSRFNINSESRTKRKFDSREVSQKLEEAAKEPRSCSSPTQPVVGAYTVHDGVMQAVTVDPYSARQLPGPFKQRHIWENGCDSTGVMDNSTGKHYLQQVYAYPQGGPPPSIHQLNSPYSGPPLYEYPRPPDLATESSQHAWITSPPTRNLLGISDTGNVTSSLGLNSSNARDSFVTRDYLGISTFPSKVNAMQAAKSGPQSTGQFPSTDVANAVHAFGSSPFCDKACIPIAQSWPYMPALGAPFPRRPEVQLMGSSADATAGTPSCNQCVLSMNAGAQTNSGSRYSSGDPRAYKVANFVRGPISGNYQARLPAQSNSQTPSFLTGTGLVPRAPSPVPVQQAPRRVTSVVPQVMHAPGRMQTNVRVDGPPQVYSHGDNQSLKRKTTDSTGLVSWGQKKRLIHVPPSSMMGVPIDPSTPRHVRWTGFNNPPPPSPSGYKCQLCKRDLSFAPEGQEPQAVNPPAVAVLPCGHTFHDHCLRNMTPDDHAHEPPCIPCVIGEK